MRFVTVLRILAVITVPGLTAEQPSGNDPRGEFYRLSRDLFEQAAPPEIRVLYAFPSREEWDFQVGRLERALAGGSLNELAALATEARPALGALRLVPGSEEIADWLEQRVDAMLAAGLVEEVRRLLPLGLAVNPSAARAIGYREVIALLNGELPAARLRDEIAANTRALVKKQRTWFRTQLPPHRIVDAAALTDVDALFPVAEAPPRDA